MSKISTCRTAIEFHSHTDMAAPTTGSKPDEFGYDWRIYWLCSHGVFVARSWKILGKKQHREGKDSTVIKSIVPIRFAQ